MFVGYPTSHSKDKFRMWDPIARKVHVTFNISWLNRMLLMIKDEESFEFTELLAYDNPRGISIGDKYDISIMTTIMMIIIYMMLMLNFQQVIMQLSRKVYWITKKQNLVELLKLQKIRIVCKSIARW
jgi:hypothetical protein